LRVVVGGPPGRGLRAGGRAQGAAGVVDQPEAPAPPHLVDLLRRGSCEPDAEGRVLSVTPESAGLQYVGFSAVRLRARERRTWSLGGREVCVVLLGGPCVLRAGGTSVDRTKGRASPFDGPPHVLYVPPGMEFSADAQDGAVDLAIGSAPALRGGPPAGGGPAGGARRGRTGRGTRGSKCVARGTWSGGSIIC